MNIKPFDAYKVLGLKRDATHDQIKAAHRKIAKEKHPDLTKGSGEIMATANEAKKMHELRGDYGLDQFVVSVQVSYEPAFFDFG